MSTDPHYLKVLHFKTLAMLEHAMGANPAFLKELVAALDNELHGTRNEDEVDAVLERALAEAFRLMGTPNVVLRDDGVTPFIRGGEHLERIAVTGYRALEFARLMDKYGPIDAWLKVADGAALFTECTASFFAWLKAFDLAPYGLTVAIDGQGTT